MLKLPLLSIFTIGTSGYIFAQSSESDLSFSGFFGLFCCITCISLVPAIITMVGLYKVFEKAGQPPWTAFIPILNNAVIAHLVGREWWWGVIPYLNIVPYFELAKAFGKSSGYGVGVVLLSPVFVPMLGFGEAQYQLPPRQPLV